MEDKSASLQAAAAVHRVPSHRLSLFPVASFFFRARLIAGAAGLTVSARRARRYVKNADVNVRPVSSIKQLSSSRDAVVDRPFIHTAARLLASTDVLTDT